MSEASDRTSSAEKPKKKVTDYDEFVAEIGEFGLWQKIICLILWVPAIAGGIHVLMYSFTGLAPEHYRCDISDCNATNYDGYIWEDDDKTQSCEYHESVTDDDGICVRANTNKIITCKQGPYIIEDFEFESTTITRFNILCDKEGFFISVRKLLTYLLLIVRILACIYWILLHDWLIDW